MKIAVTHGTKEYPTIDTLNIHDKIKDLAQEITKFLESEHNFELQFQGSPIPESDYESDFKSLDFSAEDVNHVYVTLKNIGGMN